MVKKIMITGANGQLGSEIRQLGVPGDYELLFTDIDSLDLTDRDRALSYLGRTVPDVVVNCAAYTAVDKAEEEPGKAEKLNVGIPEMLAKYGKHSGCRIIHISTDYVFSGKEARPLYENDPAEPQSVYGKTKREGELALLEYDKAMIMRTSWLYSSYGHNFVKTMHKLLQEKKELKVVFDQVGSPTYAADLAEVIMIAATLKEKKVEPGIYHYSNEGIASWYDLAFEIREITGASCRIIPIETKAYPLPAPRPSFAVLNKEKIKTQFGIEIPHWKTSLVKCLDILNR